MDLVGESPVYCSAAVIDAMFLNTYSGRMVPNIVVGSRGVLSFFGKILGDLRGGLGDLHMALFN